MNYIFNRVGTIRYEISKTLLPEERKLPLEENKLRKLLLFLDDKCEYCRLNKIGKTGDHFYPMIVKKRPGNYCDDAWNRIPCCSTCNSSKGGTEWKQWIGNVLQTKQTCKQPPKGCKNPLYQLSISELKELYGRFKIYDGVMRYYCQKRKPSDFVFYDKKMVLVTDFLSKLQDNVVEYVIERDKNDEEDDDDEDKVENKDEDEDVVINAFSGLKM